MISIKYNGQELAVKQFSLQITREPVDMDAPLEWTMPNTTFSATLKTNPEIDIKTLFNLRRKLVVNMSTDEQMQYWRNIRITTTIEWGGIDWRIVRRDWKRRRVHFIEEPKQ